MKLSLPLIPLSLAASLGTLGLSSCDRVTELATEVTSEVTSLVKLEKRRQGMRYIHPASEADLDQWLLEPNVLVSLYFYDSSVPSNLQMKSQLAQVAKTYEDVSAVLSFDIGKPSDITNMALNRFNIQETPTLKLMLNSEEVAQTVGPIASNELDELYASHTSGIDTTMELVTEGKLPGMDAKRPVEEMMIRQRKDELPSGIERVFVPEGVNDITEKMPDKK